MAVRRNKRLIGIAMLAIACSLVAALVIGSGAQAKGHHHGKSANACREWGNKLPQKLKAPQARSAIACYLNKERKSHGMRKLDVTKSLNRASQRHTNYMVRHNCFDHECPGEATLDSRLKKVNYLRGGLRSWTYGENIAWGGGHLGTPKQMVKAWMHSAGHRANILNPTFRDLGIGFKAGSPSGGSRSSGTYTTDFGFRAG